MTYTGSSLTPSGVGGTLATVRDTETSYARKFEMTSWQPQNTAALSLSDHEDIITRHLFGYRGYSLGAPSSNKMIVSTLTNVPTHTKDWASGLTSVDWVTAQHISSTDPTTDYAGHKVNVTNGTVTLDVFKYTSSTVNTWAEADAAHRFYIVAQGA